MFFERKTNLFIGRFAELYGSDIVLHAFSTRKGGVSKSPYNVLNLCDRCGDKQKSVTINRKRFFRSIGIQTENTAIPEQVHGVHIQFAERPGVYSETDGLLTNIPGIFLVVQTADCLPVYLFDPIHNAIGLIHAGWKGTAQKIVSFAVHNLQNHFKTQPEELRAYFGPSIGPCCYEVGVDVSQHFSHHVMNKNRLDLWKANRDLLVESGVKTDHIYISGLCTSCYSDWFFSHRKSGGRTGRMMAIFGIQKKEL